MVAGVLLQHDRPQLVDSAGIELDTTLRSWDAAWNRPLPELGRRLGAGRAVRRVRPPSGPGLPRGRRLRRDLLRLLGGRRPRSSAAARRPSLRSRGECARAAQARPDARRCLTGPAAPRGIRPRLRARAVSRRAAQRLPTRAKIALLDWPVLLVHLLVRRELGPLRERRRGTRAGLARPALRAPFELATVSFGEALGRQVGQLRLRASGSLPTHFDQSTPGAPRTAWLGARAPTTGRPGTRR